MTSRSLETLVGAAVLVVAAFFLVFAYQKADVAEAGGKSVHANFQSVGSLQAGDDVRIAGIKVGTVTAMELDPDWYVARVTMSIDPGIRVPGDTIVSVASDGLLGGNHVALTPGADDDAVEDGHTFVNTQGAVNLTDLFSRAVFGGIPSE